MWEPKCDTHEYFWKYGSIKKKKKEKKKNISEEEESGIQKKNCGSWYPACKHI